MLGHAERVEEAPGRVELVEVDAAVAGHVRELHEALALVAAVAHLEQVGRDLRRVQFAVLVAVHGVEGLLDLVLLGARIREG